MIQPKRLFVFLFVLISSWSHATEWTIYSLPDPKAAPSRTSVSDPDNYIDAVTEDSINAVTWDIEQQTGVQFAIVIVNSIGSEVPKTFASNLFNHWQIGKSGKDNGLLLVIVIGQKRWEFETGYGLEATLPDYTCKTLGTDYLVPYFKTGDYQAGIYSVSRAVRKTLFTRLGISLKDSLDLPEISSAYSENYTNAGTSTGESIFEMAGQRNTTPILWFSGIYILIMTIWYFVVFGKKNAQKKNKKNTDKNPETPKPSKPAFFLAYFFPLASAMAWYFYPDFGGGRGFLLLLILPAYLSIMFLVTGYRLRLNRSVFEKHDGNLYETYSSLRLSHNMWTLLAPLFFPPVFIPYLFWYYRKCRQLRRAPRACQKCSALMTFGKNVVDEKSDDQYLSTGQVKEEYLKSRDWDVWLCGSCHEVEILGYKAFFTSYAQCPQCSFLTEVSEGSVTIQAATYTSSGSGKRMYRCKNCGNYRETYYTIPIKTRSSSGSSGSSYGGGGGGGGSSWGGGRSGGGGAGGGW